MSSSSPIKNTKKYYELKAFFTEEVNYIIGTSD